MPAHICFVTETPIAEIKAHLETCGVPVRMEGPRAGAIGTIQSVYIDDPTELDRDLDHATLMRRADHRGEDGSNLQSLPRRTGEPDGIPFKWLLAQGGCAIWRGGRGADATAPGSG